MILFCRIIAVFLLTIFSLDVANAQRGGGGVPFLSNININARGGTSGGGGIASFLNGNGNGGGLGNLIGQITKNLGNIGGRSRPLRDGGVVDRNPAKREDFGKRAGSIVSSILAMGRNSNKTGPAAFLDGFGLSSPALSSSSLGTRTRRGRVPLNNGPTSRRYRYRTSEFWNRPRPQPRRPVTDRNTGPQQPSPPADKVRLSFSKDPDPDSYASSDEEYFEVPSALEVMPGDEKSEEGPTSSGRRPNPGQKRPGWPRWSFGSTVATTKRPSRGRWVGRPASRRPLPFTPRQRTTTPRPRPRPRPTRTNRSRVTRRPNRPRTSARPNIRVTRPTGKPRPTPRPKPGPGTDDLDVDFLYY